MIEKNEESLSTPLLSHEEDRQQIEISSLLSTIEGQELTKTTQYKKNKTGAYSYKQKQNNTKSKISEGDLLEYRIKRLVFYMGYFPEIGVKLRASTDEQADTITDLDVFGTYIHKDFSSKTIWVDCKSGQARPLERISWLLGVKSIVDIDDIIFVKRGVRVDTKQFARKQGIQILELNIINKLENDYKIDENDWRGSWNYITQLNQLLVLQKIDIPNNDTCKRIGNFINISYWTLDNFTKVKKCITALRQLGEIEQYPLNAEQYKAVHWGIYKILTLFTLAMLNICKELYYLSEMDKKSIISEGLISGEISLKKRTEITDATYRLAYNVILQHIPNFSGTVKIPNIGSSPPPYSEAFTNLIFRVTNSPLDYFDILRFMDFIFMEYDLQTKALETNKIKEFFSDYDNLVNSTKTIIHFVCSITNIRRDLFTYTK